MTDKCRQEEQIKSIVLSNRLESDRLLAKGTEILQQRERRYYGFRDNTVLHPRHYDGGSQKGTGGAGDGWQQSLQEDGAEPF